MKGFLLILALVLAAPLKADKRRLSSELLPSGEVTSLTRQEYEGARLLFDYSVNNTYCLYADRYGEEVTYSVGAVVNTRYGRMTCTRIFISHKTNRTMMVWTPG